ncbi:DUF1064 domain-containing protein [Acinetobacter nosocomialis]|uniref:DUF1064 domain-containing protein n=1 Tax=Acinetobacter nosocomialis TaxID=106654 RepID=UPI002706EE5B|nr:DUF1064 domain-containing protein [Acinetobacter nosocomialis]MDO7194639.1 DUF1064 domain-containing protein [Acinetobacter nosocomialis]HCI7192435.1 DUF1064 domain-containing protein [Acinetobacter baumannii]
MSSISLADYRASCPKAQKSNKGRNKFNASKIKLDGMTFDSIKEYKRYIELKALQQRGEIKELRHHTKFELAPRIKIEGEKRTKPALRYFADFTYFTAAGVYVVEDVKSVATRKLPSYRNKKHLMKTVHNIDVREV